MCSSICILVLSILVIGIRGQTFNPLQDGECPATSEGWKKLADARSCPGNAPYHCVINEYGEFGEVCVKESWVQPGFCPEYNTAAKKINVKRCQPFDGFSCSTQAFQSHQTYSHEICLRKPKPTTTTMAPPVTTTAAVSEGSSPAGAIIAVLILLILAIVGFILVWWFYLRKNYNCEIPNPFTGGTITICHKPVEESKKDADNSDADNSDTEGKPLLQAEKIVNRSNPYFVETKIYREIIRQLEKNNVVLVVGNTGIGKSATSIGVLEHYRDRKEWKTIHFPLDPIEKVKERTIVLVDAAFGDLSLYSRYDSKIENMMNRLYTSTRECKEYKVLITSSSSLRNSQTNFPILKGCSELNMSYNISDLKDLHEMYTKPKLNVVNETEEKSKERPKSNKVVNNNKSSDKTKDTSNHEDRETSSVLVKDNDKTDNPINSGQKLSDSVGSTKSDDGPPKSGMDPQQSLQSDMRNGTNIAGDLNQTSTEDICNENEAHAKSSRDIETESYCPLISESRENGETDPSKVVIEIIGDHEKRNHEDSDKLRQEGEETWRRSHVSEFGLPVECYLPVGIEWNVSSSGETGVMSIFERYFSSLANSENGQDRQKCKTLVYIMLNGSVVDSGCLHKKMLSEIDQDLNQERFLLHATVLAESGILSRKGNVFSFHNDLLLFAVINSFAQQNIRTFLTYCYLPFSLQFLGPKSTGSRSPRILKVEVDVDWRTLFEFWSGLFKQQGGSRNELQDIKLFKLFREKVEYHETGTMEFYDIKDKDMTDKKGNVYVRQMVNTYPKLKEYYSWAEPEKFKSIKDNDFKSTTKRHPPCSLE